MISEQIDFMMQRTHIYPRRNSRLSVLEDKQKADVALLIGQIQSVDLYRRRLAQVDQLRRKYEDEYRSRRAMDRIFERSTTDRAVVEQKSLRDAVYSFFEKPRHKYRMAARRTSRLLRRQERRRQEFEKLLRQRHYA